MEQDVVKQFYEKLDGSFGIIAIDRADKTAVDKLVRLLRLLDVTKPMNTDDLMKVWKKVSDSGRDVKRYYPRKTSTGT